MSDPKLVRPGDPQKAAMEALQTAKLLGAEIAVVLVSVPDGAFYATWTGNNLTALGLVEACKDIVKSTIIQRGAAA